MGISANNNLSLIFIKLKDWGSAIEKASLVLDIEPSNLKALMRRGQARLEDGFLDLAKKDLKKAQALDKSNSYIKKLLKVCTVRHKKYVQKQQKLHAGMFGGGGGGKKKKNKRKKVEEAKEESGDKMDVDAGKEKNATKDDNEMDVDK